MHCKGCGESMEGDGYTIALHCPNVDVSYMTPDCDPVYCEIEDELVDRHYEIIGE